MAVVIHGVGIVVISINAVNVVYISVVVVIKTVVGDLVGVYPAVAH